jgi:hypothetical protein
VEANKLLGLQIDNSLNWKKHIEKIIPKLSSACFAMRTVIPLMTIDTVWVWVLKPCRTRYGERGSWNKEK